MRHIFPLILFSFFTICSAKPAKNLILILADDLGWADTTLYGKTSLYETPNIERLAKRGMKFSNAYSSPNLFTHPGKYFNRPKPSPPRNDLTGRSSSRGPAGCNRTNPWGTSSEILQS
jgi:hypothetical protein